MYALDNDVQVSGSQTHDESSKSAEGMDVEAIILQKLSSDCGMYTRYTLRRHANCLVVA